MQILQGNFDNVNKENPDLRGWVIGSFIKEPSEFHSDEFEVKWARHKKGYFKEGLSTDSKVETISIMISGKFKISITDKASGKVESVVLEKQGDYVTYDSKEADHWAEALEDSLLIVIRWPSKR